MKPLYMQFQQGKDINLRTVWVNMNQVCTIAPNDDKSSVLTFACILQDEPAYLIVNETVASIADRFAAL